MLYFAYGSNLNVDELAERWKHTPRFVSTAFWPDARLRFHYRSKTRKGGALDLVEHRGSATPGVLFEADLELLDRKEGVGIGHYRRIEGMAIGEDGPVRAITYRVCDDMRQGRFVEPTVEYVELVRAGLRAFDLPEYVFDAALRHDDAGWPPGVFVYGTLKRGHEREALMRNAALRSVHDAQVPGRLVDLGEYPGWMRGEGRVHGEVWSYHALDELFATLDPVEDFEGWERLEASMYHRTLVQADVGGTRRWAWTYEYRGEDPGNTIPSGTWIRD